MWNVLVGVFNNMTFSRNVQTIQKFSDILVFDGSGLLNKCNALRYCFNWISSKSQFVLKIDNPVLKLNQWSLLSNTRNDYNPKNIRIKNVMICLTFWSFEFSHVTPSCILTFRMNFSPRKFLTSTKDPFSEIAQLMGKWAYTARILYLYP